MKEAYSAGIFKGGRRRGFHPHHQFIEVSNIYIQKKEKENCIKMWPGD